MRPAAVKMLNELSFVNSADPPQLRRIMALGAGTGGRVLPPSRVKRDATACALYKFIRPFLGANEHREALLCCWQHREDRV